VAGVKPSLAVDLNGVVLASPVIAAAGCLGSDRDGTGLVEVRRLGAVVTRSLTYRPSRGSPTPRVAEAAAGIVTAVGLQNEGVEDFVSQDLPWLARHGAPVIASVAGTTLEEYVHVAGHLQARTGIVALEVHLSGPDQERGHHPFFERIERIAEVVGAVSRVSRLPVFAKLPAMLPDLVDAAHACVRVGAHGLTLIDAMPAMVIDTARLRPKLGSIVGGLSGPAILPIAVAAVYRVARSMPDVPIMGVGGIATSDDAVQFLLAGAWAVQIGTAMLVDPDTPVNVAKGIQAYLGDKGIASPAGIRGRVRDEPASSLGAAT
jgi:dihydroorotate dehydrogenase (NAD+) catalytic subunit